MRDELADDAEEFNIPGDLLTVERDFVVNYDDWDAFLLFDMCATQWRITPMGERSGLDYSAVVSVAQIFDAEFDREMLEKVRLLEAGALSAMRGKDLTDLLNG